MSQAVASQREQSSNNIVVTPATAQKTVVLSIDSKRVAALQATLYTLGMRFEKRTAELEMQVIERCKAEECLRELTNRILQVQDDQARRIARDLHDSAGQYLAAIQMNLNAIERDSSSLTASQAKRVSDSIEMVSYCTSEIRTLSYLLHPPLLDEMGLASALAVYAEGFEDRSGIRVGLDISRDFERLPTDIETALFRIVQQSLANIHRHSGSRTAMIVVRQDEKEITLRISDEGLGIGPEALGEMNSGTRLIGVGIAGMRERTRIMNGRFCIRSSQRGTTIEINLPIVESLDQARS
jgi:two-component system NarL family sensor kinase